MDWSDKYMQQSQAFLFNPVMAASKYMKKQQWYKRFWLVAEEG